MTTSTMPLSQRLALFIARSTGWRLETPAIMPPKCLIIGAHHTSSSDFFATLIYSFGSRLNFRWIAKDSAFGWPLGWFMRKLGGIPVTRSSSNNFVSQIVAMYNATDQLRIAMAPEGTRSEAKYWRTGFYYIALGAQIPIMLGYADYKHKVVGIGGQLMPSGDIEADMKLIAQFYEPITPRHPSRRGEVRLKQHTE